MCLPPAFSEDFWKSKPYTEWTEKELKKMLTNSPWAKDVAAGMQGMGGGMAPAPTAKVRWQTALPVKQALVKMKFGAEAATSTQAQQLLASVDTFYLIVMEGLPQRIAQMGGARLQENLKKSTMLKRGDKPPILPTQIEVGVADKLVLIYYAFPKTDAIVLEDKEVEFVSKVGPMEFKKKFKLADMVMDGKLTL